MARVTKKKTEKQENTVEVKAEKSLTRAEKKTATQQLIKEVLQKNPHKHNDLIDEVSKAYANKFGGEETENINDVKGRVGSVLDIMKKDGDVLFDGGMYALKMELKAVEADKKEERTAKKVTRAKAKKTEVKTGEVKAETPILPMEEKQEKPAVKKTAKKATKTTQKAAKAKENEAMPQTETEEVLPLPPGPIQPIAPVAPITPEVAPEPAPVQPTPEKTDEKPAKKPTRGKAKKVTETASEKETPSQGEKIKNEPPMVALNVEITEEKQEKMPEKTVEIQNPPILKEKGEIAPKDVVDMSFLFGNVKPKMEKAAEKPIKTETEQSEQKAIVLEKLAPIEKQEKVSVKEEVKEIKEIKEIKPEIKQEAKQENKQENKHPTRRVSTRGNVKDIRKVEKPQTADERLRDAYLKRMRALGGDYFEYYSVYLLERYSMKNGRRLEGMRISGGDHDGGIDGEIELTDKFGFKETIYIQSKNWDPEKGKEEYWVVGETLLQQFIGACACRQAKDRKQHCRGIFITTSRFTPEAKRILDDMSDKIVGYDGADLYEAAKECQFGVIYENGNWKLDEKLLSGIKAFFNML